MAERLGRSCRRPSAEGTAGGAAKAKDATRSSGGVAASGLASAASGRPGSPAIRSVQLPHVVHHERRPEEDVKKARITNQNVPEWVWM